MRRKQCSGLQMCRPPDKMASDRCLLPILSGATIYALLKLTGLEASWLPALVGAAVCGTWVLFGKRKWFFSVSLASMLLVLLICKSRFQGGFCQWYNILGRTCTAEHGIVLPPLEASAAPFDIHIFTCWLAALAGMGMALLWQFGKEVAGASVLVVCGGICLVLGRMVDPLPLLLAAATLCTGKEWRKRALPTGILAAAVLLSGISAFSDWAGDLSGEVLQTVHTQRYETKYTTLPEGRLEPIVQSDSAALIVTMEKPEVMYLRGFTGAQLKDGRWQPLDNRILAEQQELLYWLNSREFDLRAQFEAAASVMQTGQNTVTVQNVGACSAYRYIPFTIRRDDRLDPENLMETATGARYDSFTTVFGGAELLAQLMTVLGSESSRYLQAEAAYREFVEANYLSIPAELAGKMQPYWEKARGMDAQAAVKAVLADCYPDGIRFDPYYATAAVLTLRHFGIPARYAEGYITPRTTAVTVELTGRHAGCWAEVYHDGIGWLPMALTPGLNGEAQQPQEQSLPDTPEETLPPETEPITEPQSDGGQQVRIAQALFSGTVVLTIGLLLLILLLLLRRKHILKKRQSILNQEDIRDAITWSFADAVRILERMGIRRGNGSLDALIQPLQDRFGPEFAEQFEAASRINAKSLFSGKPMTEPEREAVHGFRQAVLVCLDAEIGRLSRLWMKYILCLF